MTGRHLLLSPASTAVKPASSAFDHRPNPIQERVSQCSQLNRKSTSNSVCGRNIGLTKREVSSSVKSLGSQPVCECDSARGPKDTFDGSAQGKSPCEVDIKEARVEGRIGVHVESDVLLECARNNNEGSCDMLCWM